MSYKTRRGNVAKKSLRFHAIVKMLSDYQRVTKLTVAASRRCVWAHGTLAERRTPEPNAGAAALPDAGTARLSHRHCVSENSLRTLLGTLQPCPAHAAWEDRELGLVAVGVGAGVAYADVEHH